MRFTKVVDNQHVCHASDNGDIDNNGTMRNFGEHSLSETADPNRYVTEVWIWVTEAHREISLLVLK